VIQTAEDAARYLDGLINRERDPRAWAGRVDLQPIEALLERLGNPERALSVLHVAGSKGKGSTCLFAESILRAEGERVGTFTSPHLERWTERFRIDGREVEGARLAAAVERLRPQVDALRAHGPPLSPSFFDATTAAGLLLFAEAGVERAIVEVGLGGRLDSTNAVRPAVCAITSIELEHVDKLGSTLAEIAFEKAGILKPGVPCVAGALPPEAEAVVARRAAELGAPLERLGVDFPPEVGLGALGSPQCANAALALAAVRRLGRERAAGFEERARAALRATRLPGRIELVRSEPWVIVDSAHTGASARALAEVLRAIPFETARLVLSVSADKDLAAVLDPLLPLARRLTVTRADRDRSLDPAAIAAAARRARPELELRVVPNPHLAVRA
jgi:dihydrofolate synthase/folylpolyglutamate synthase